MTVSIPTLCTREDVKGVLDVAETARSNADIDRAIEAATEDVRGTLRRDLIPWVGTRYFNWPDVAYRIPWRLWLDDRELISVTAIVAGGVPVTSYFLEPDTGPPFSWVETDLSASTVFQAGATRQRAIAITGTFGYRDDEDTVGELDGTLADTTDATASVTWSTSRVGVGSLLRIDDERVLVTDRTMVDSGQSLQTPLTAQPSAVQVAVEDGTAFGVDELLLLDGERMRVVEIAGNTLTVKRAVDGSVLAAHSGSAVYALTGVVLARAQRGTTIAEHQAADPIRRLLVPPLARELAVAHALCTHLQERAAYARVVGSGEGQMEAAGKGLRSIEADTIVRFGRQVFVGAV